MGKKIVFLSDSTGNSAGGVWRTNVLRTFQALDLTGSEQVAIYDDGVATSSFKPLAILGGVFGFGLGRNVLNLYKFACRTYKTKTDFLLTGRSLPESACQRRIATSTNVGSISVRRLDRWLPPQSVPCRDLKTARRPRRRRCYCSGLADAYIQSALGGMLRLSVLATCRYSP